MNRLFSSLAILLILFTPFLSAGDNIKVLKEALLDFEAEVYRDGTQGVLDTLSIESAKGSLASWHEYKFEKEYEAFNEKVDSFEELYKNQ